MLATMVNECNCCGKNISHSQSKLRCCNCMLYYHTRCVYTNADVQDWLCFHCTGNIFPFNHFVNDDEFKFALFTFDNSIEYNDFLNLKFNPINLDDVIHNAFNDHLGLNSCTYVIDSEQVPVSHDDDFSILHLNPRMSIKIFDIHAFISGLRGYCRPVFGLFRHFTQKLQNISNK